MSDHQKIHSSKSNEWYTPLEYVEAARAVMDGIELDPASCEQANQFVRAKRILTLKDDGLGQIWRARSVWLNPPYGYGPGHVSNQDLWSAKLIAEYETGRVGQAILLVNAVTDRTWFGPLWRFPICFTDHRIAFIDQEGNQQKDPTHGNAFVGIGVDLRRFVLRFSRFGRVVAPLQLDQLREEPDEAEIFASLDWLRAGWGIEANAHDYVKMIAKTHGLTVSQALRYLQIWARERLGQSFDLAA